MTNGEWEAEYKRGMESFAPSGMRLKKDVLKKWAAETARFHRDLSYSYRKRMEYHLSMIRRYDSLVYKHAVKAAKTGLGPDGTYPVSNVKTGFSRAAYHERLADEFRELAAKHALKVVHLMERVDSKTKLAAWYE